MKVCNPLYCRYLGWRRSRSSWPFLGLGGGGGRGGGGGVKKGKGGRIGSMCYKTLMTD